MRKGTQLDVNRLRTSFYDLGFLVEVNDNLTEARSRKVLKEFANRSDHGTLCMVVILSHGFSNGNFACYDYYDWCPFGYQVQRSGYVSAKYSSSNAFASFENIELLLFYSKEPCFLACVST